MAKRDESIVPLSREHHHALVLCLKIRRGLQRCSEDSNWLSMAASNVVRFFETDLASHFAAEEQVLFTSIEGQGEWDKQVKNLLAEHDEIRRMVSQIRSAGAEDLPYLLARFAARLEQHIRKEENEIFPLYENMAALEIRKNVRRAVYQLLGDAMKPRSPEIVLTAWELCKGSSP